MNTHLCTLEISHGLKPISGCQKELSNPVQSSPALSFPLAHASPDWVNVAMSMSISPGEQWAPLVGKKEDITGVSLSGNCSVQHVSPKTPLQHSNLHASPEGSKVPSEVPCQRGPAGGCIPLPLCLRLLAGGRVSGLGAAKCCHG